MSTKTIEIDAKRYEDSDTCLTDCAADVARERGLESWQIEAEWADDNRETIVVTIPA